MERKKIGAQTYLIPSKEGVNIEIDQKVVLWKKLFLFVWLMLIVVSGFFIAPDLHLLADEFSVEVVFYWIVLFAWLFFIMRIGKVLLWRSVGREIIEINDGVFSLRHAYAKYGRAQKFEVKDILKFRIVDRSNDMLKQYFDYDFISTGNERFEFEYRKKEFICGKSLSDKDSEVLFRIINKELLKQKRNHK